MYNVIDYKVELSEYKVVKPFIEKWHYSHNTHGLQSLYCFALFGENMFGLDKIVGAAIVGTPSSPNGQIPIELVISYDDSYGNTYAISEFFNLNIDGSISDSISTNVQNCPESNNLLLPFASQQDDCPSSLQFFNTPTMIGTGIFVFIIVILLMRRRNNNQPF